MSAIPDALVRCLAVAAFASAWAPACASESFQGELPPCRCEVAGCSVESCPIEVTLDETCAADVELAEVLVDEHVELEAVRAGESVTMCSRIEPGSPARIYVRGGPWIWGPVVERCEQPGEVRTLLLQCIEAR